MPEVAEAPVPVAAPSAPAPSAAPSAPAPSAPEAPAVATEAPAAAPAPESAPAAPSEAYVPAAGGKAPVNTDYPNTADGIESFINDLEGWRAVNQGVDPTAEKPAEVKPVEEVKPAAEAPKPVEGAPATPEMLDKWTEKSAAVKQLLEAEPEFKKEVMATARYAETAKPVLALVPTKEDAEFAVKNTHQFLTLQHDFALASDNPEVGERGWKSFTELFQVVDKEGKPVVGADGQPQMAESFDFIAKKFTTGALTSSVQNAKQQFEQLKKDFETKAYPNEAARKQAEEAMEKAQYHYEALDYAASAILAEAVDDGLPELPPDATPQQIAFQKKLEEEAEKLGQGKASSKKQARIEAHQAYEKEVNTEFNKNVGLYLDNEIKARRERGEYIPDAILKQRYFNPVTQKQEQVSAFAANMLFSVTAKMYSIPTVAQKLREFELMGPAAKEARLSYIREKQNEYLPGLVEEYLTEVQNGVREMSTQQQAQQDKIKEVARVEPQTSGAPAPQQALTGQALKNRAQAICDADPEYQRMGRIDQAARHIEVMEEIRAGKKS